MGTRSKKKSGTRHAKAPKRQKRAVVSVSMPAALVRRIDAACKALQQNRSEWVQEACEMHLGQAETAAKLLGDPVAREVLFRAAASPEALQAFAKALGAEVDQAQLSLFSEAMMRVVDESREGWEGRS